jgi:hypothetical protein
VVAAVEHADGTACCAELADGEWRLLQGLGTGAVLEAKCEYRVQEAVTMARALQAMNAGGLLFYKFTSLNCLQGFSLQCELGFWGISIRLLCWRSSVIIGCCGWGVEAAAGPGHWGCAGGKMRVSCARSCHYGMRTAGHERRWVKQTLVCVEGCGVLLLGVSTLYCCVGRQVRLIVWCRRLLQ